jgi:hypothetical protein
MWEKRHNRDPRPRAEFPPAEHEPGHEDLGRPRRIDGDRFICPGCGEMATAKNGRFCCGCGHFVHGGCAIPGLRVWACPTCGLDLVG